MTSGVSVDRTTYHLPRRTPYSNIYGPSHAFPPFQVANLWCEEEMHACFLIFEISHNVVSDMVQQGSKSNLQDINISREVIATASLPLVVLLSLLYCVEYMSLHVNFIFIYFDYWLAFSHTWIFKFTLEKCKLNEIHTFMSDHLFSTRRLDFTRVKTECCPWNFPKCLHKQYESHVWTFLQLTGLF